MKLPAVRLLCTLLLFACAGGARAADFAYPPTIALEEVAQWIDKAPREHPRLLTNRAELAALARRAAAEPMLAPIARVVVHEANKLLDAEPVVRELEGRRLLGVSRRAVGRVLTLAMAYHLTGEKRYAQRCEREMLTAARFSDWNPSHFLDVGEMTFALAIGYDWLFDQLSPASRQEIRGAIIEKGVILPWETRYKSWVRASNNWGQVCHGGITAGALAVLEDEPELAAKTVHNALHNVTRSMASYAPAGSYPEGPGYWSYGTTYNVILLSLLESVFRSDFGLSQAPGFNQTGQYLPLATGPSGLRFNYADGGANGGLEVAMYWFASRYDRPDWLLGQDEALRQYVKELLASSRHSGGDRFFPLLLLWADTGKQPAQAKVRMPLNWQSGGETAIAVHRGSWTDRGAIYVGLKGGSPSDSHGQMDIGSFVLDADGVRWAHDLGSEGYHGIESRGMDLWGRGQDSDRWTIFRQSNAGHNTLVIDGRLQTARARAEMVAFSDDAQLAYSVLDMSDVYQGQARSAIRIVAMAGGREVWIEDRLTGLEPGSRVRWGMITKGQPTSGPAQTLQLTEGKARLRLTIASPKPSVWQVIDTAKRRHEWDSPNPGTRMVAFESVAPPSGQLVLAVLATPGSVDKSIGDRLLGRQWTPPAERPRGK